MRMSASKKTEQEVKAMKYSVRLKALLKKYSHGWLFTYWILYLSWFYLLEKKVTLYTGYHVISSPIDDHIPFVEYFIVPYILWFGFIGVVFAYFFLFDKEGFYKFSCMTYIGMTVFLIISTVFPNGLELRPYFFDRQNVFTDLVATLYMTDTPTNVFPSLHVFNTLAACVAIAHSDRLRKRKILCAAAYTLSVLIILATMFLKQHSVVDVIGGFGMAYVLYRFVYEPFGGRVPVPENSK